MYWIRIKDLAVDFTKISTVHIGQVHDTYLIFADGDDLHLSWAFDTSEERDEALDDLIDELKEGNNGMD